MLTISLDEQGDFENLNNEIDTKPVFIGGIIYDDQNYEGDYDNEKNRLDQYLKNICKSEKIRYPHDMHYSKDCTNGKSVKLFKTKFSETIKEFLTDGTWQGSSIIEPARKGKYYIFSNIRGEGGKQKLLGSNISKAVREDFAGNLYLHMAEDIIERILFHNPVIKDITEIKLDLATRRVILTGENRPVKMKEFEKLGYQQVLREENVGKKISEYVLTNPDNYRTAVEREMIKSGKVGYKLDRLSAKSIYYENKKSGMEFLYLADAICSYLAFKIPGKKPSEWIQAFSDRSKDINGNVRNLIFSYDETDDYFDKAYKAYENNDYFNSLSIIYDGCHSKYPTAPYYAEYWMTCITETIINSADALGISLAIKHLKEFAKSNNLNQNKFIFLYKTLEKAAQNVDFASIKEESELYDLYDAGISAYIHVGNTEGAMECYEKSKKYASYVATETYLRTRNKICVYLCDTLRFREAYEVADENVKYHEILSDMKKKLFGDSYSDALNHAIALSQRGQVFAFMDDTRAEDDFKKALSMMDKETPDYLITQSYLMHYFICQHKQKEYEEMVLEYFAGKEDLNDQFNYLVKEASKGIKSRFSLKYALFIFVKALYVFYFHDLPDDLVDRLTNIEESMQKISKKAISQMNGHPWEIIYKYLRM